MPFGKLVVETIVKNDMVVTEVARNCRNVKDS